MYRWKLKKWATRIATQFIQRYGNPRYAAEEYKEFAEYFREHTATLLLEPVMSLLAERANGLYLTDPVHRMCLQYMANAVEMSPTYKLIKPHMGYVIAQVIFPTLCLSDEDLALFDDDPHEFVRKAFNPYEDWLEPRTAATSLLESLVRYRAKVAWPGRLALFCVLFSHLGPFPTRFKKRISPFSDDMMLQSDCSSVFLLPSLPVPAVLTPFPAFSASFHFPLLVV
jgi:hypothetical protein